MEGEPLMLGDLLRQTREQKNLSLNDVEQGTNIRKSYIKAIEDGNYEKLPGEVFLKGFIKAYGRFLGLDGKALIDQYKEEKNSTYSDSKINDTTTEESVSNIQQEKVTSADTTIKKENPIKKSPKSTVPNIGSLNTNDQYLKTQNSGNKRNIILLILIIVIIIGGAIMYLSFSQTSDEPKPSTPPVQQQTTQEQTTSSTPTQEVITDSQVSATFNQDCWTEVTADGKVILSETVKAGSSLNWKANKQIDITVGNAGAVDVTFNGQPIGKLGDVGAVVTKSFPAPNQSNQSTQQNANQTQQ